MQIFFFSELLGIGKGKKGWSQTTRSEILERNKQKKSLKNVNI